MSDTAVADAVEAPAIEPVNTEEDKAKLMKYSPSEAAIATLTGKAQELMALDASDPANYDRIRLHIADMRTTRTKIDKHRLALTAKAREWQAECNKEGYRLMGLIEPVEELLKAKKKLVDDAKEAAKKAAEDAERKRVEDEVRRQQEAEEARKAEERRQEEERLEKIRKEQAERQAELDRQQAELDRKRAEQEAADRAAREAQEAADRKAREEREAADRAAREKAAKEAAERQRLIDEENERVRQEQERERLRLEQQRKDLEAEQARQREERERLEREKFEREAQERAAKEARERAEREAAEKAERELREKERQAAEQRRLEAIRPDVDKVRGFGEMLAGITWPGNVKSKEAKAALAAAHDGIATVAKKLIAFQAE
jgi:hypothetical protein